MHNGSNIKQEQYTNRKQKMTGGNLMDQQLQMICPAFQEEGGQQQIASPRDRRTAEYAHPVDVRMMRILDQPYIRDAVSAIVSFNIDSNYGLDLASGVNINEKTNPELYKILADCSARMGIPVPYTIISSSVSGINACTMGSDKFSFISLSNFLSALMSQDELSFVLGHECGHLSLGHVVYHTAATIFGSAASFIPVIGPVIGKAISYPLLAWCRRSEISADRAGLICCRNINTAKRALFKLEAGFSHMNDVDIDSYLANSRDMMNKVTFGRFRELFMSHPIIPKRIEALDLFSRSQLYYRAICKPFSEGDELISDAALEKQTEAIISTISNPLSQKSK
jgi:hypothetical protein